MNRNTSILLGEHFDTFIQDRISEGRYKNASEVVRAGLRLLKEEEYKYRSLKASIEEGIGSGIATDFNPQTHLAKLRAKK